MGHSVTIIACTLDAFPVLAAAVDFRRSGAKPGQVLPPIGYSESRGQALIWVDRISSSETAPPDLAEISRIVPIWALTVVELDAYAILERYQDGEVTCAIWSTPGDFARIKSYGECPFDKEALEAMAVAQQSDGLDIEATPFTIPILAFRELTGVDYDEVDGRAVEPASATLPLEV